MAGNVYVHNASNEPLDLRLNGAPAGNVQGWSQGPNRFQLAAPLAVPRVLNASEGQGRFVNGTNQLALQGPGASYSAQVAIDGRQLPLHQNLNLFVTRNRWSLVNDYAVEIASGEIRPSWD